MIRSYFLYLSAIGFSLGIFGILFLQLNFWQIILVAWLSVLLNLKSKHKIWVFIVTASFLSGAIRTTLVNQPSVISEFYNQEVSIIGQVFSEPEIGQSKNRLRIKIQTLNINNKIIRPKENVLISISKYPEYHTGDWVQLSGKIQKPENFDNDNGIEFDYQNFLAKDRIFSLIYYTKIDLIHRSDNPGIAFWLFKIKNNFLKQLSTILPSPEAELLGGLLLGVKRSLGKDLEDQFRKSGLIHIVVLSGYNITIIVIAVFKFLGFLPRLIKYFLGILFVFCFAIMVGSGATVIRASIMAVLVIIGKVSSREYNINKSLTFAGLLMVIHNPLILFYDPSFQLSFVASLGLVNLSQKLSELIPFITEKFGVREIVSSTLSTQIAVLPMILKMTGEISLVALPVNLIVLPLIPLTMFLGFLTGVFSYIYWPLGLIFGYLPNLLLKFELLMVTFSANLPFATINVSPPSIFGTILFYSLIIIFFYYRPIQIFKKVFNIITLTAWQIISHKRMFPHIKR